MYDQRVMEDTIAGKNGVILDASMQADIMNMKSAVESEYAYPRQSKNHRLVQRMLSGALFGQKWTDLVCGQMESNISVLVGASLMFNNIISSPYLSYTCDPIYIYIYIT